MRITDYIRPEHIFVGVPPRPKTELVEDLLRKVVETGVELPVEAALASLVAREGQASTGLGLGVAVPHATVDGLADTLVLVATVPDGTDFDSLDGEPARVVFMILNPTARMGDHIRLLARVARLANRAGVIDSLAAAADVDGVVEILREDDAHHPGAQ